MTVHCPENHTRLESIDDFVDELIAQDHHRLLDLDIARWREDLQARLARVQQHPEQSLGFIEETIRQSALELQRALVQKAMQAKADAVDEKCPDCQRPLRDKKRRVARNIDAYCGKVRLRRTHGWCAGCQKWFFPADRVLGLQEDSHGGTPKPCADAKRNSNVGIGFTRPPVSASSTGAARVNPKTNFARSSPNATTWPRAAASTT